MDKELYQHLLKQAANHRDTTGDFYDKRAKMMKTSSKDAKDRLMKHEIECQIAQASSAISRNAEASGRTDSDLSDLFSIAGIVRKK